MPEHIIRPFLFDGEITVRIIDRDGEPWFVAADVCRALGIINSADAVGGLADDEKGIGSTDTLGGHQEVMTINESGLFVLIFKSRKPDASRFRKWVTSDVLPTLRKTGAYFMSPSQGQNGLVKKPWVEWSLEERRLALAEVNTTKRVFNTASAVWMWGHLGLPMPPTNLLPAWWQGELGIRSATFSN